MYHSFGDEPENKYDIDLEVFRSQMKWLLASGYTVESISQYYKRSELGKFPSKYVILTFDDGYKSFLQAAEILNSFSISGTFFITKDWREKRVNMLSEKEIKDLSLLHDIGSHSVTHPNLSKLSPKQINHELVFSKNWLEAITKKEIISFSIPGGDSNSLVYQLGFEAGYKIICNSTEWWNSLSKINSKSIIRRVAIRKSFTQKTFIAIVRLNIAFYLYRQLRSVFLFLPKRIL